MRIVKHYINSFLLIEFFLIVVFCVLDLLMFYIFFESVLIPMFLIVGIWGSRERKILASYYFFLYDNQVASTVVAILSTFAELGNVTILSNNNNFDGFKIEHL